MKILATAGLEVIWIYSLYMMKELNIEKTLVIKEIFV